MKKKDLENALRQAYRAGQDSVSCMIVINRGMAKPGCMCDDNPCSCLVDDTSTAEDETVEKILANP